MLYRRHILAKFGIAYLADALHALVDALVVRVGPGLGLLAGLNEEDGVAHGVLE